MRLGSQEDWIIFNLIGVGIFVTDTQILKSMDRDKINGTITMIFKPMDKNLKNGQFLKSNTSAK